MSETSIEGIRVSYVIADEAAMFTTREGEEVTANAVWIEADAKARVIDITAFGQGEEDLECANWWSLDDYEKMPDWIPTPPQWFTDAAQELIGDE